MQLGFFFFIPWATPCIISADMGSLAGNKGDIERNGKTIILMEECRCEIFTGLHKDTSPILTFTNRLVLETGILT